MKKGILKSIGAIFPGFAVGTALSVATDKILEKMGIIKTTSFDENPAWQISVVVGYRTIYNATGAYLAARPTPKDPVKHAITLGIIGVVFSIAGAIAMWHVPPYSYSITLIFLTLPAAGCGGKMAMKKINHQKKLKNEKTNVSVFMV